MPLFFPIQAPQTSTQPRARAGVSLTPDFTTSLPRLLFRSSNPFRFSFHPWNTNTMGSSNKMSLIVRMCTDSLADSTLNCRSCPEDFYRSKLNRWQVGRFSVMDKFSFEKSNLRNFIDILIFSD